MLVSASSYAPACIVDRLFDTFLSDAAASGVRQAVFLASDLDPRPYQLPWPADMTVYVVDTPEILAVHPFGRIPALRDGEFGLFETSAILRYVEEAFDGPSLLPGTISDRARCEQWISATNAYLYDTMVRRFVLQYIFPRGEGGKPDAGVIGAALKEMPAQLAALDAACARSDFLAGPSVSMADLFVAPILAYVDGMPEGRTLLASAPNLMRSQARVRERPSFGSTQPPRS